MFEIMLVLDPIRIDEKSFREMYLQYWDQVFKGNYVTLTGWRKQIQDSGRYVERHIVGASTAART